MRYLIAGALAVAACLVPWSNAAVAGPSTNGMVLQAIYDTGDLWYAWLGGGSDGIAVGGHPSATGVDTATAQVFWADDATNKIMVGDAGNPGGTAAALSTTGATTNGIRGLVVDVADGKVYWANETADKLSWAALNGSGGGDINTSGATVSAPSGVALDVTHHRIYWANGADDTHPIAWADISNAQSGGGDLNVTGATASGARGPSIDSANGKVYWSNLANSTISYANLDGSGGGGQLDVSGATINGPHGTAVDPDNGYVYWINYGANSTSISYAALDGSGGADLTSYYTGPGSLFPSLVEAPRGTAAASGNSGVGDTLTCTVSWKPDDPGALLYRAPSTATSYQWTRDGNGIDGATSSTYAVQADDIGHELRCLASATVAWGPSTTTLTSNAIDAETVVAPRVFWADTQANAISWATFDGTKRGSVSTAGVTVDDPEGIALDAAANRVWWSNAGANTISYADIGGAGGHDLDVGSAPVNIPHGIAVDPVAGKVYWANLGGNSIGWANMDGSGGGTLDTSGAEVSVPTSVVVDHAASRVYWTNAGDQSHQVSYASLSGGGGHDFDTSGVAQASPTGVAVDTAHSKVLWMNSSGLFAAGLNGGSPAAVDTGAASFSSPRGLAIDQGNGRVWWANSDLGLVSYANLDGSGGGTDISAGDAFPSAVALLGQPENTTLPSVGAAVAGSPLTCDPGTWAADDAAAFLSRAPLSYAYEWLRDGSPTGSTDSTYDTSALDAGHQFSCSVTASNPGGAVTASSAATTVQGIPGYVYWSNYTGQSIGFASLDGSGGGSFTEIPGGQDLKPAGTAIDVAAGRVYWLDSANFGIEYGDLGTGANPSGQFVGNATVLTPRGLVLDKSAQRLYWANKLSNKISVAVLGAGGNGAGSDFITDAQTVNQPEGVAVDAGAGRLYWANSGDNSHPISWVSLSGNGSGGDIAIGGATASGASALALDTAAGIVYWTNFNNNTVSWAYVNGTGGGQVDTTGASINGPIGIALDAARHVLVVTSENNNTVSLVSIGATTGGSDLTTTGANPSSPMYPVLFEPPAASAAPQVTGTAVPGAKLTCSQGTWAGDDLGAQLYRRALSYAYQWTRDGVNIAGATTTKLLLQPGDAGKEIGCRVTATNPAGSTPAESTPVTTAAYGTAKKLVFVAGPSSLASGSSADFTVEVRDVYGNTVLSPSQSVSFAKSSGGGSVTGLGTVDSSSGRATVSPSGVVAGRMTIRATASGLTAASATVTVVPGPASILRFSTSSVSLKQGLTFKLKVFLEDAAGNTATSSHALVALTSHGTAVLAGLGSVTATKGVATVSVKGIGVGTSWIQATSHALSPDSTKFVVFR